MFADVIRRLSQMLKAPVGLEMRIIYSCLVSSAKPILLYFFTLIGQHLLLPFTHPLLSIAVLQVIDVSIFSQVTRMPT